MPSPASHKRRRHLVLVGAGHAHLHVLKNISALVHEGHQCTLIAPGNFWYSGLATGVVGGLYPPALDQIDIGRLARHGGTEFIREQVLGLNADASTLHLANGRSIRFDVLSLNPGSVTPAIDGETLYANRCFATKPIERLCRLPQVLDEFVSRRDAVNLIVAGGGAAAFELAGNLLGLGERANRTMNVTLMTRSQRVLRQLSPGGARSVVSSLARRGLRILTEHPVTRVTADGVETEQGQHFECDFVVNATGLSPHPLAQGAGIAVDEDGAMRVDSTLRSISHPTIYGGGDFIALEGHRLTRLGVHAVRQAPVLVTNLQAALSGKPPRQHFRPRRHHLWIMNLGDGTGLAARGQWWWRGRSAFWLKDRIDRRFLRRYV